MHPTNQNHSRQPVVRSLSALLPALATALLLAACAGTPQSQITQTAAPGQPEVIIWENRNSHSNNEATLQLVVKAGSLQETDEQLGYAHFVEHMVFRGTDNYPGEAMRERMREFDVDIGHHSNAYTTFDHTAFWLDLNTVAPERLDAALSILSEFAFRATFDAEAVESERAIVLEEWRMTEPESDRTSQQVYDDYYAGSRHLDRHPIGTESSIREATAADLKAFYRTWYRPDNMAIIVAGDVDTAEVQALIDEHFTVDNLVGFEPPAEWHNAPKPEVWDLDLTARASIFKSTDPFIPDGYVDLQFFAPQSKPTDSNQVLDLMKIDIAMAILQDRLEERVATHSDAITDVLWDLNHPTPNVRALSLGVALVEDDFETGLTVLESERQRLLHEGITRQELDDALSRWLDHERTEQDSAGFLADVALDHYLYGWPMTAQPDWVDLIEQQTADWTPESVVSALASTMAVTPQVRVIYPYTATPPSDEELSHWLEKAYVPSEPAESALTAEDTDSHLDNIALIGDWAIDPEYQGTIVAEETLDHDVVQWSLSNGMTVFYKHTDANPGVVDFKLVGLGGFNRLTEAETATARQAVDAFTQSGLRDLNGPGLNRWLQNHNMTLEFNVDFYDRYATGDTPSEQFGLSMNLLHVALTEARVDPALAAQLQQRHHAQLRQLASHPQGEWWALLEEVLHMNEPALRTLTPAEIDAATPEQMQAYYDDHITGAQNYVLAIAGDLDRDSAKAEVLRAIASLPPSETVLPDTRQLPMPTTSNGYRSDGSGERQASISLRYAIDRNHTDLGRAELNMLEHWLDEVLMDEIREASGLAYFVQADTEGYTRFHDDFVLWVHLATDPNRVEEAIDRVESVLIEASESTLQQPQVNRWRTRMNNDRRRGGANGSWIASRLAYDALFEREPAQGLNLEGAWVDATDLPVLLAQFMQSEAVRSEFVLMP